MSASVCAEQDKPASCGCSCLLLWTSSSAHLVLHVQDDVVAGQRLELARAAHRHAGAVQLEAQVLVVGVHLHVSEVGSC